MRNGRRMITPPTWNSAAATAEVRRSGLFIGGSLLPASRRIVRPATRAFVSSMSPSGFHGNERQVLPSLDRKRAAAHHFSHGPLPGEGKGSQQNKGGAMKARHPFVLAIAALALVAFQSGARAEPTKTVAVDCSAGETIAKALTLGDERKPLLVQISGTCSEHLLIDRNDVTLAAGAPGASVSGPDPAIDVIRVTGSPGTIDSTTVPGGRNGIPADGAAGPCRPNPPVQGTAR